ncbi:MAG: hypothetical protein MRJ65_13110 [Candidatus Brocadiaceae bacterium]|nr:hypothetical protein [Candidatus Brocadiaceae bacterium]
MRKFGYFFGVISIVALLLFTYGNKKTFASSCCDAKSATAAEQTNSKCVVCGGSINKNRSVTVICEEKSITVCNENCAAVFKKDPCRYCKDERCEKRKSHQHRESHQ